MVNNLVNVTVEKERKFLADNLNSLSPDILHCITNLLMLKEIKFKGNLKLEMNLAFRDGVLSEEIKYNIVEGFLSAGISPKYCVYKDSEGGLRFEKLEVKDN